MRMHGSSLLRHLFFHTTVLSLRHMTSTGHHKKPPHRWRCNRTTCFRTYRHRNTTMRHHRCVRKSFTLLSLRGLPSDPFPLRRWCSSQVYSSASPVEITLMLYPLRTAKRGWQHPCRGCSSYCWLPYDWMEAPGTLAQPSVVCSG